VLVSGSPMVASPQHGKELRLSALVVL
jgi:hypothetical protein